jgi:hypothetical protein
MDTIDLKLAQECESLAVAASEGVSWLKDAANQSPTVAQQAPSLISELQKVRNQSRKLSRAARRRMCAGVFGPSQAGKSYLVSILASRDGRPLQARFGDKTYDFLREINPPGNRESTGLVTRFGLGLSDVTPDFPVRVRLLTQTDIVKILGNSFLLDFDHQKAAFEKPDGTAIRKRLAELRTQVLPKPPGDLDADDVLDLIEYFDTFFAGVTSELRTEYWREAIDLAPRLSGRDRAKLWSVLWYDFQPFTELYLTLYEGLEKLAFAPEALLGMDALIPREKSIIDVLTLDKLGTDAADTLLVRPKLPASDAEDARLPRSLICALTAELSVAIAEKPWDFFDHTDLLDFPGARSRLKLANLEDVAKAKGVAEGANPLRELLLRGKVAYLFQRYSAERELSAILLCIPDGNQEVRDLSDMMTAWIDQTIGGTPADRAKQKNSLFLVLTKMDREFEQKAGETEESRKLRWSARLNNSLINNFRGEWPGNWNGRPFDNTFWLRNPTVLDERLMDHDGRRETGVAEAFAQRAVELRTHFVENFDVQRHFANPARAWDEAFKANDGGVSYLVNSLIPVCDPAIKRAQVRGQLDVQLHRLVDRLAGFHSAADGDSRAKKRDLVHAVLRGLATCIQQQLFGELVGQLQVADSALRDIYLRIATARTAEGEPERKNGKLPGQVTQSSGATVDLGAIFADVFGEEDGRKAPPAGVLEDRAERFAREAAEYWLENMRRIGADEKALSHFGVDRQHLGWLIDELVVGAHRLRLVDQLSVDVRALENAANAKWEDIAERQVRTAASALNGYVSALGFDQLPVEQRPGLPPNAPTRRVFQNPSPPEGAPVLSEDPSSIYADYCRDWMRAFLQLAMDNVGYEGGREITAEQNEQLGMILRQVQMAA